MYSPNGIELWRQRRAGLMRQAERERLIRQLQAGRSKSRFRGLRPLVGSLRLVFGARPEKETKLAECR